MDAPPTRARGLGRLWSASLAWNLAAWGHLVVAIAFASTLVVEPSPPPRVATTALSDGGRLRGRAVLVIVDALRLDVARDPSIMPRLVELAERGESRVALVESLVPSTVAGIRAIATGRVPPPISFLEDFSASVDPAYSLFDAVRIAGGASFVAGPTLWTDLYGERIDGSFTSAKLSAEDGPILEAALPVLRSGSHDLVVVHLWRCDELAHRHGGDSEEYLDGARWTDHAIARLAAACDERTTLFITSDHGVTASGGHAGPERAVLETPWVVVDTGRATGAPGREAPIRQSDIASIISETIGAPWSQPAAIEASGASWLGLRWAALAVVALIAASTLGARLAAGTAPPLAASCLDAAFWVAGACLLLGWHPAATAVGTCALLGCGALWGSTRLLGSALVAIGVGVAALALRAAAATAASAAEPAASWTASADGAALALLAAALLLPTLRRRDDASGLRAPSTRPSWRRVAIASGCVVIAGLAGGARLAVAVLLAHALGSRLGRALASGASGRRLVLAGSGVLLASIALGRLAGDGFSLSTIDVRHAFGLVDGHLGLGGAVVLVLLRHAILPVALLAGLAPGLGRASPRTVAPLFAGCALAATGQALGCGVLLSAPSDGIVLASLGVGGLLRSFTELNTVLLPAALWTLAVDLRRRRAPAASIVSAADTAQPTSAASSASTTPQ